MAGIGGGYGAAFAGMATGKEPQATSGENS